MKMKTNYIFKLNQRIFHHYLKQFPELEIKNIGSSITKQFIDGVGREPTEQELKKYIEIIVMPTPDCDLRRKQIKSLHRLIKKNNEKNNRKGFKNPDQLHVG